jgi:hypothetical protein
MSIKNRPYAGSWEMGRQTIVRYTPDAKVLINGHTELAVCATCGDSTDFNKYITTISCDVSTDPVSTASLTLVVPRHEAEVFAHDGNYVLHPGLEVVILMRGYFPVTGYAMKGQEGASAETAATDSADDKLPVYPYYQVFRGVMTEVSHEYSGGFYTASVTCSSILHFWQYLYIKTNGSVFGTAPEGEGGGIDLRGHKFTSMSPYAIIYTLMRIGFGAAFGQSWTISQANNLAAVDETSGKSLYKHAALWWEKRWSESSMRLRMYGMDGSLFNAMEQSYLGMFDKSEIKVSEFVKDLDVETKDGYDPNAAASRQATARRIGYRGTETTAAIMDEKGSKLDALKMQAYTLDLGRMGQVNMFEAEYMSKLEIANTVKELCGYEFYQDVDGDIVFKPPFYNLDTSEDEVYCIRDRDLISCSESEREPEATYVKGSGSLFTNFQNVLSGEFGTREGKFADWRLIAKFGWRETSFESHYYSGAKQMFIGAVLRLDVANSEMRTAQITIPMRPEMRPGYPVWIEHLDCFFYAKALSHSFAPGSSAQTTITGIAKRAKWLPPGLPDRSEGPGSQPLPTLDDMRLDAPGDYPPMPLYVFQEDVEGSESGASGPPRIMGLPNVVMALDPTKINPAVLPGGSLYFTNGQTYFDTALTLGALRRDPDNPGQYRVAVDNDPANDLILSEQQVVTAFDNYAQAAQMAEGEEKETALANAKSTEFGALVTAVESRLGSAVPDAGQLNAYMGLQRNIKNVFGAGKAAGEYRYFSSSAPEVEDQSPSSVTVDAEQQKVLMEIPGGPVDSNLTGLTLLYQKGDRIGVKGGMPRRGFRVYGFNPPGEDEEADTAIGHIDTSTREIRFVTFQKITNRVPVTNATIGSNGRAALLMAPKSMAALFREILVATADTGQVGDSAEDRFGGDTAQNKKGYGMLWDAIQNLASDLGVTGQSDWSDLDGVTIGSPEGEDLSVFANSFEAFTKSVQTAAAGTEKQTYYVYPALYAVGTRFVAHPRQGQEAEPVQFPGGIGDKNGVPLEKRTRNIATDPTYRRVLIPKDVSLQVSRESRSNIGLTNKSDPQGVAAVATRSGEALSLNFQFVQQVWYQTWPDETTDPTEAEETAYADFMAKITEEFDFEVNNTNGKTEVYVGEYVEKGMYTTVLPVSDNRGYEVYGTMAYGRGLTIKSYKSLLEINGSPTDTASMLAVERFLAVLIATPYSEDWVSNALGALGGAGKAELASIMEVEEGNLESAIKNLKSSSDSAAVFVRNTPVTTSSRGQSYTMVVSASELASLTTSDTTICLCKGTENSYWIEAFTGEFVELHGDEAVNEFLVAEATAAGEGYTITKQALSGEMMDLSSGNKLAESIQGAKTAFQSLGNAKRTAGQAIDEEFREAAAAVRRDAESVGDLIDQAREAESLTEFNENATPRSVSQGTREQEQERIEEAEEQLTQTTGVPIEYFTFLTDPTLGAANEDQGDDT